MIPDVWMEAAQWIMIAILGFCVMALGARK